MDRPYRFGDITRMAVTWLGPHARAVKNEFDWLKFGKALVLGVLTTGTLNYVSTICALAGAAKDPDWATGIPAILGVLVYALDQIRRIMHGQPSDVPPYPMTQEDPSGQEASPTTQGQVQSGQAPIAAAAVAVQRPEAVVQIGDIPEVGHGRSVTITETPQ
jgi:hypothetical protein